MRFDKKKLIQTSEPLTQEASTTHRQALARLVGKHSLENAQNPFGTKDYRCGISSQHGGYAGTSVKDT